MLEELKTVKMDITHHIINMKYVHARILTGDNKIICILVNIENAIMVERLDTNEEIIKFLKSLSDEKLYRDRTSFDKAKEVLDNVYGVIK